MVNTSKVLTVSYGTFSCTLEGFDDSFDTMKAIAEYFRDLAADDRYFGAEPPTPDADMMARIAEREIARRVEAHEDNGSIHLRATQGGAAASAALLADQSIEQQEDDLDVAELVDAAMADAGVEVEAAPAKPAAKKAKKTKAAEETVEETIEETVENITDDVAEDIDIAATEVEDLVAEETDASDIVDDDSALAKLQRIQSVVNGDATTASAYSEDEHAQDILDTPQELVEETSSDDMDDDESLEALLKGIDIEEDDASDDYLTDDDLQETATAEDTLAQLLEDAMPAEEETAKDVVQEVTDPAPAEPKATKPKSKVRVMKMKRSEFEAAVADGLIAEDDDNVGTDLSADEEAELRKELDQVEAELKDSTDRSADGFAKLDNGQQSDDVSRIFDETASQLDAPESNERRNAIQHLRGAVAATRAGESAGNATAQVTDTDGYRENLNEVVRPKRPAPKSKKTQRPAKQTPLRLVAEQRIDVPSEPVRPRRVKAEEVAQSAASSEEFASFLNQTGAHELPDLMEAAASFLTDFEGHIDITRPMLMGKVKEGNKSAFSREESLRCFADLLRQGKLAKTDKGRIMVTEMTKYRDLDARHAV